MLCPHTAAVNRSTGKLTSSHLSAASTGRGIGGVEGRVVRFSLDDNLNGQLTLSDDGKWLRGHYHDRPSEPIDLEWRSN
jgi:hypothetical protein